MNHVENWLPKYKIYGSDKIREALIAIGVSDAQLEVFVAALHAAKKVKPSRAVENPTEGPEILTRKARAAVFQRDGNKCQHCGSIEGLCVDHIHPKSRGGKSALRNLQVLCRSCNSAKRDKI